MLLPTLCPACNESLESAHQFGGTIVCQCGWTQSEQRSRAETKSKKGVIAVVVAIAGLVLASLIHVAEWDHFSAEIVPLKMKQWTGSATKADLHRVVTICESRKKPQCVEKAFFQLSQKLVEDKSILEKLAQIQVSNKNLVGATQTFEKYFKIKGRDIEMVHSYANVLATTGQVKRSEEFFKWGMQLAGKKPDPGLVRDYVVVLMGNGEFIKAQKQIHSFRRKSQLGGLFLEKELREIQKRLKVAKL
ncbi:MAG: hypothetical protein H6626_06465 [Pseudobdellovibrionaceae bacterium]|nr:hypothetical protein [Bdellovibrionales bacterium]USN48729.1 MAG: hypothetical protein H6626_06465 [Pseudobdellovibrionaceae bacterium]